MALEVETKYSYTYLKGILTFISSAYLPRTSQGACSFTKMMSLFVKDDCKRETKQPPELTFINKKERNHSQWSMWCVTIPYSSWNVVSVFCHPIFLLLSWKPCVPPLHGKEDMESRQMHLWVSWVCISWRKLYAGCAHQHGCYLTERCLAKTWGCAAKRRRGI